MSRSPFSLPCLALGLLMSAAAWAVAPATPPDEEAPSVTQIDPQLLQQRLEQRRQFREKRLQQAIDNGDVSEQEADQLRQRWSARDILILKWRSGQLSPDERQQLQESWQQQWKSLTPEQRERFKRFLGEHGPATVSPPSVAPTPLRPAPAPKRFKGKPLPERPLWPMNPA